MEIQMMQPPAAQQGPDYTLLILTIVYNVVLFAISTISIYFIARKTGFDDKAWFSFIPGLNLVLMLDIADKPRWWVVFIGAPLAFIMPVFYLVPWVSRTLEFVKPGETPAMVIVELIIYALITIFSLVGLTLFVITSIEVSKKRGLGAGWGVLMGAVPFLGLPVTAFAEPLKS